MTTAVYPGSFDPVTNGHLDVISRGAELFDKVIVGVLHNSTKSPLFSVEERVRILNEATKDLTNVEIVAFSGLSVDFARQCKAKVIIRGLRAITDFEYELQMAQTNRVLAPDVDTMFLTTSLEYAYLSSTTVKEVAAFGGDISKFVPGFVMDELKERVFEPFFRVDKSRSRELGGVGLGLALVREIVRVHDGSITVQSGSSGGTVFDVVFTQ